jgi:hypothetical protein
VEDKKKMMKPYPSNWAIISKLTVISAFNFTTVSFHAYSIVSSMAFTFPFPFDLDHIGLSSLTFCVTLVARHDGSLPFDINSPGAGTLSLAGCQPTYSAVLYQLLNKVQALGLTSTSPSLDDSSTWDTNSPLDLLLVMTTSPLTISRLCPLHEHLLLPV